VVGADKILLHSFGRAGWSALIFMKVDFAGKKMPNRFWRTDFIPPPKCCFMSPLKGVTVFE
jgi:hypothetical protein